MDPEFLCNAEFVHNFLCTLRIDSAVGLDQIPAWFLRPLATPLAPVLAALINRCLLEGGFPRVWKRARIAPIPKVAGTQCISEFRPIVILPVLSKLAETWILHLLDGYLETSDCQFGFKRGAGTQDAIAIAQFSLEKALSSCPSAKKAAIISLDVAKAFDRCPFGLILKELESRAVPVPVLRLLASYFQDRVQVVKCGRVLSSERQVLSGIGQGSLLGPAIFNVFIDGIFSLDLKSSATVLGFADDLLIIAPLSTTADHQLLQADVDAISAFYSSRGLELNPKKSAVMLAQISPHVHFDGVYFTLCNQPLPIVAELKYLGIILHQSLSFQLHTDSVVSHSKRALGALFAAFKGVPSDRMRYLYTTKIQPLLLYALPVVCPGTKRDWFELERANRFACRLLTNNYTSSYLNLLRDLQLQPLQFVCMKRQLILCYQYVNGRRQFPGQLLEPEQRGRLNMIRRQHNLQIRLPASARLSALPLFIASAVWNYCDFNENKDANVFPMDLDFKNFKHFLNYSALYPYLCSRFSISGSEKYFYSVDSL